MPVSIHTNKYMDLNEIWLSCNISDHFTVVEFFYGLTVLMKGAENKENSMKNKMVKRCSWFEVECRDCGEN